MTAAKPMFTPAAALGLLGKLMATVRPEFRVDILVPERGALVFDAAPCQVLGCVRQPRTRGLCKGHYYAWQQEGRPDIDAFAATASPEGLGRKELTVCVVQGCRYGGARRGLCVRHQGFWERAGKPDRSTWLAGLAPMHDPDHPVCALSYCTLWTHGRSLFCVNHRSRWEAVGRPDIDEFTVLCESYAPLPQRERMALLGHLLTGHELPLRSRVAGIIVLLYAQRLSRIVQLTIDDVIRSGDQVLLRLGEPPAPVPTTFAKLLLTWINERDNMNTATNPNSRWLFPGRRARQPMCPQASAP
ncbi:MAG: hypothetical protein ACRDTA_24615 [Pseudonocardiaceae bacterium]